MMRQFAPCGRRAMSWAACLARIPPAPLVPALTAMLVVVAGCDTEVLRLPDAGDAARVDSGRDAADGEVVDGWEGEPMDVPADERSNDDAAADPGTADCHPAMAPTCRWNDTPVSCDIAAGHAASTVATSPRALCEAACGVSGGIESLNRTFEQEGLPWTWTIADLACDACCTLSYVPPVESPEDGSACTRDLCTGSSCYHLAWEWIGQPCQNANDFGTCSGTWACDRSCYTDQVDCWPGVKRCTAAQPGPDLANGTDDDCDGQTDEGSDGGVLQWTQGDGARDPSLAALDDGRFVVAWTDFPPGTQWSYFTRIQVRTGTKASPMGGVAVMLDASAGQRNVHKPCVFGLSGGRFGMSWVGTDVTEPGPPISRQVLRVYRNAADPPESVWDYDVPHDGGDIDCPTLLAGADGSFTVAVSDTVDDPADRFLLQRYDASGRAGPPFELPGMGRLNRRLLAGPDGRILAGWQGRSEDRQNRVTFRARWYAADGQPLTQEFPLTDEVYRSQAAGGGPVFANLPDGGALASWSGRPVYDQGQHVRFLLLPWGALPEAAPTWMTGTPAGQQNVADLSVFGDDVVAVWRRREDDVNAEGLFATRLDLPDLSSGASLEIRRPVNGLVTDPKVATLADGTIAVLWTYQEVPLATMSSSLRLVLIPRHFGEGTR